MWGARAWDRVTSAPWRAKASWGVCGGRDFPAASPALSHAGRHLETLPSSDLTHVHANGALISRAATLICNMSDGYQVLTTFGFLIPFPQNKGSSRGRRRGFGREPERTEHRAAGAGCPKGAGDPGCLSRVCRSLSPSQARSTPRCLSTAACSKPFHFLDTESSCRLMGLKLG